MKKQLLPLLGAMLLSIFSWAQPAQLQINLHLSTNSPAILGNAIPGYQILIWDMTSGGSGAGPSFFTDANGNLIKTLTSQFTTGSGKFIVEVRDCQHQLVYTKTINYSSPGAQVAVTDSVNVPCVDPCNVVASAFMKTTNEYGFYSNAVQQRWDMTNAFWEFSDGTTHTGRSIKKQFPLGTHSWKMTHMGCAIDSGSFVVTGTCDASFTVDTASSIGGVVNILNTSTATNPANTLYYLWDFGDGTTSTQAFPQHQYSGNGPYSIFLSITEVDALGDTICNSWHGDTLGIDSAGNIIYKAGFTVNVQDPAALGLIQNDLANFNLYPQPATNEVRIKANARLEKAELIDLNGRVLNVWDLNTGNNAELELDSPVPGMYILRVKSAMGSSSRKLIIR